MGAICPSICGEGVVPPTRCAQISVIGLQIMNVFQLIILISAFVTGDSTNGIISVIFVLVLFCAWRFLQYRIVVIYVLYCMFLFIMSLVWLLTIAQNKKKLFTSGMDSAKAAFQLIYCVYYFIVSIICFFIYREFKAISFEKNPAILKYFQDRNNSMNDNANESGNIGEDNRFAPDYGEMQPRERNVNRVQENRQVTQVFAGKGVMIGGN